MDKNKETALREANAAGLRHRGTDTYWSYYDAIMDTAYKMGREHGVDIVEAPIVDAHRWGQPPQSGISRNHADDINEYGCSVAWLDDDPGKMWGQWSMAKGLDDVLITGILVPELTGSDGEPLLLLLTGDVD